MGTSVTLSLFNCNYGIKMYAVGTIFIGSMACICTDISKSFTDIITRYPSYFVFRIYIEMRLGVVH